MKAFKLNILNSILFLITCGCLSIGYNNTTLYFLYCVLLFITTQLWRYNGMCILVIIERSKSIKYFFKLTKKVYKKKYLVSMFVYISYATVTCVIPISLIIKFFIK